MATQTRTVKAHLVQTSPDFSVWTTRTALRCRTCSEGAGQIIGGADLWMPLGTVRNPGDSGSPAAQTPLSSVVGGFVRVLISDPVGAIVIGSEEYSALWHGVIDSQVISDAGGGSGAQSFSCAGLAAILARSPVREVYCLSVDYTGAISYVPALRPPTFNDRDSQGHTADYLASIDGTSVELFDLFGSTPWNSSSPWTAKQAVAAVLAANGRYRTPGTSSYVGALTWSLSAGTLLDWTLPTMDPAGMTVLDFINAVANPRRGLTWRLSVSGSTATITVMSIAATAITVGGTTLPAATSTATPDLTEIWADDVTLVEDQSATYDHIRVVGARPLVSCSVSFDPAGPPAEVGSLQPAWTVAQETAWNTAASEETDGVWRTFRLGVKWSGDMAENAGASGLRQSLTVSSGDYTGERSFSGSQQAATSLVEIEPWTPAGQGWTTSAAGPRQGCLAFILPDGSSTWEDCQSDGVMSRTVTVESCPASISIGDASRGPVFADSDQLRNKNCIGSTGKILVTVGIREPDPLVVSWTRASGSWPRSSPRVLSVHMPTAEQWVILDGTVTGITSGGALVRRTGDATVRDDTPRMQSALAFLRAYYAEPAVALSWTDRGVISFEYSAGSAMPGALVTTATLGTGAATINAVITRRSWTLDADGYGTSYTTERVVPDIEAVL